MSDADESSDGQKANIRLPDSTVGYCRPPKRTRFKSGQSGNPRGRPRGSRGLKNVVAEVLAEPVTIREGEKTRRVPLLKAMVKANSLKAAQGNTSAFNAVVSLAIKTEKLEDSDANAASRETLAAEDQDIIREYMKRQPANDCSPGEDEQ
jgi:Family of unknown function (DUF5681)